MTKIQIFRNFYGYAIWLLFFSVCCSPVPSKVELTAGQAGSADSLVVAIKKLGARIQSNDKNKVLSIFTFPLADSQVTALFYDSAFSGTHRKTSELLSKDILAENYKAFRKALQMDEFAAMFSVLAIDSLNLTNDIYTERSIKNQPCLRYYEIRIEERNVWFNYGTNTNRAYHSSEKDTTESIGDECEYSLIWHFRWQGGNLVFVDQQSAG